MKSLSKEQLENIAAGEIGTVGHISERAREMALELLQRRAAVPAVPVVPDEKTVADYPEGAGIFISKFDYGHLAGWNACRAEMLQSAGNSKQVNVPATQDGWKLVPIEPTPDMIAAAMNIDDVTFDKDDETVIYVHHDDIYSAMLAAAPQPPAPSDRIVPVVPVRDEYGFWRHPNRLDTPFDEDGASTRTYEAWFAEHGMEVDFTYMDQVFCDDCVYGDNVERPALHWNPKSPHGDGWILTAIFDTEDGPCAEWIRYKFDDTP